MPNRWIFIVVLYAIAWGCVGCSYGNNDVNASCSCSLEEKDCRESVLSAMEEPTKEILISDFELAYFNEKIFNQNAGKSLYNYFLSCTYDEPEEVNLFAVFCNIQSLKEINDEREKEDVLSEVAGVIDSEFSPRKITVPEMDNILKQYLGRSLGDMKGIGLDLFLCLPSYEAYYVFGDESDTYMAPMVKFLAGEREGDLVRLFYNAKDTNLDGMEEAVLACVTLQETKSGYKVISNKVVPIPEFLNAPPAVKISLADAPLYTMTQLSRETHEDDNSYCFAKKESEVGTICAYKATDGNCYLGVLYDELAWEVGVFQRLPDDAYGLGFGLDCFSDLAGYPGIKVMYDVNGRSFWEVYCLTDSGTFLLAKGNESVAIVDLDASGGDELIVFNDGTPQIIFGRGGVLRYADIDKLIQKYWQNGECLEFGPVDIRDKRLSFSKEALAENGTTQNEEVWFIYFFQDALYFYRYAT